MVLASFGIVFICRMKKVIPEVDCFVWEGAGGERVLSGCRGRS